MDISSLPDDVFLLIASHLSPDDLVQSRRVCKNWLAALTRPDTAFEFLKWHFPRSREMRLAAAVDGLTAVPQDGFRQELDDSFELRLVLELGRPTRDWAGLFATVARRYHFLRRATPRTTESMERVGAGHPFYRFYGVGTWNRFLRLDDRRAEFHYPDPEWAYGMEDGLLVYPAPATADVGKVAVEDGWDAMDHSQPGILCDEMGRVKDRTRCPYRVLDLETGHEIAVPFGADGKVIRRVRLADGVLLFEWAEREPYHNLNERTKVHRHFVSTFDVVRAPYIPEDGTATAPPPPPWTWTVSWRSDFKMHFLGVPINHTDRFFSMHNSSHYAIYVWQPNRSPWGEDDPIESLIVWDISSPDPIVTHRMAWHELEFHGIRQRHTPQLRGLALDECNLYVMSEEHRWAAGPHSSPQLPRVHSVWTVGIPIAPAGAGAKMPPYYGPAWSDTCGADGDINMSFCRRRFNTAPAAHRSTALPSRVAASVPTGPFAWRDRSGGQTLSSSRRWPFDRGGGRSPAMAACWRHEDFPYLTVGETVDAAAGVRAAARHCFLMELVSVHVRPAVSIAGPVEGAVVVDSRGGGGFDAGDGQADTDDEEDGRFGQVVRGTEKQRRGLGVEEVQCPDHVYTMLMGKGYIAGDERWIVGEAADGTITILRF